MIMKFVGSIIRRKIKVTYKLNKPNLLSSIKRNKSWFEISCFNSGRDSETNYSPPRPAQVKATCQWKEKCLVFEKWLNNVKHLTHVLLPQSPRNILKIDVLSFILEYVGDAQRDSGLVDWFLCYLGK